MDITKTRQKNWIGYILRGNSLHREIMKRSMKGKRERGRHGLDDIKRTDTGNSAFMALITVIHLPRGEG